MCNIDDLMEDHVNHAGSLFSAYYVDAHRTPQKLAFQNTQTFRRSHSGSRLRPYGVLAFEAAGWGGLGR